MNICHRLLLMLFMSLLTISAFADERILSYDSNIKVRADSSMTVTETIRVRAEGNRIKRGIYRDFPTDYKDRLGHRYRVGFEVLSVTRNDLHEPFRTERQSNGVRVYAGNPDVYLERGEYTYRITYSTNRQLGFFDDHDELYWNVTGNGWAFPIDEVTASVRLPQGIPANLIQVEAYTGFAGAQEKNYGAKVEPDGTAVFRTTRPLSANQGLTIVTSWPTGFVTPPSTSQRFSWLIADNRNLLVSLTGLLILLAYYLVAWHRVGRDPTPGVIIPRYEPAPGYSPASMRFVRRMGYDNKCFAAALVNLAVKGYLSIREEGGKFTFEKTGHENTEMAAGEKTLVNKLFLGNDSITLEQSKHKQISKAIKAHKRSLSINYEKHYFKSNAEYILIGLFISLIVLVAGIIFLPDNSDRAATLFLHVWLAGWSLGVFGLVTRVLHAWRGAHSFALKIAAAGVTLFSVPFVVGELFGTWALANASSWGVVITLVSCIALNYLFYHWMKAPTLAGRKLLDKVNGFRHYLEIAEKDELNYQHPPDKTPELFEKYLPFALALDVETQWADNFASTFANVDKDNYPYRPRWYNGNYRDLGDMRSFSSSLGSGLSSSISASSTAPGSSSGGGGGGSSGGGGGGGGGGGW